MTDFTVVGGGIAGLVVARRLALLGNAVDIIEASDRLGGIVAHRRIGGIDLDAGASSFSTRGGQVAALIDELGLSDDLVAPARTDRWLQPATGAPVKLPAGGILGIPGTPLAAEVIAAVGTPAAMRAQLEAVIPSLRARPSESLGHLVRRRLGRGMLERLVDPVVRAELGVPADELPVDQVAGLRAAMAHEGSLAAAVRSLLDGAASPARFGIRGGLNRLVTELVADLESLEVGFEFGRRVTSADEFDSEVVLAAPLGEPAQRRLVLVTLVVDAPELDAAPRGAGVVAAPGATASAAQAITHVSAEWDWVRERAEGRHVLQLAYPQEPADLAATALADARSLLGVPIASLIDLAHLDWPVGAMTAATPGSAVVGRWVAGADLAAIVRQAEHAAAEILGEH
jgi:oxygen-dependent protoporphyrinogen oxidase